MKVMIQENVEGVHFEYQLSSAKKCDHMGGNVLVQMLEFIQKLISVNLSADLRGSLLIDKSMLPVGNMRYHW